MELEILRLLHDLYKEREEKYRMKIVQRETTENVVSLHYLTENIHLFLTLENDIVPALHFTKFYCY